MAILDNITQYWNNLITSLIGQNTFQDYILFLGLFIGLFFFFLFIDKSVLAFLGALAKKTKTSWDDYVIGFLGSIGWMFYVYFSLYLSSLILTLNPFTRNILQFLLVLFVAYYIGKGISGIVDRLVTKKIEVKKNAENLENASMIKVLGIFGKVAVWILVLLMVLTNLGVEITPLIAGLGVGGIAIALGLQVILGDLFSAFVIYFDKPFKEGDFIIFDGEMGVVKYIGIKTTRISTLPGQELVVSNSDLTSSRVNNYKKMEKRRVPFTFGVTYDTPPKKLEKCKTIVKDIFVDCHKKYGEDNSPVTLDRVHFKELADFSLNFEVVYYVPTADYNVYMDVQEYVNMELIKRFEKADIEFAFPTQTIYTKKG